MIHFLILAGFLSSIANAQDVPPPPKPQDDVPSLADTMKFIEEKLGSIGRVNYIAYIHDNVTGNDWTNKVSSEATNVRASATGCRIDYHFRLTYDEKVMQDEDGRFSLMAVQQVVVETLEQGLKQRDAKAGHPEWTSRVNPPVFLVVVNLKNEKYEFGLCDESLASRIARALVHAVELCGGGSKDPF